MIKISLDESYVFDILSIYEIKIKKSDGDKQKKLKLSHQLLETEIIEQIGIIKYNEIKSSNEYDLLCESNKNVFELVDRASESQLSKITADANYERYLHKINIQKNFFQIENTEVKL
jgi:hypothetical protein